jgi:hypothetical protein
VGAKVTKYESKQAVEAYRDRLQYHDLQKRRLFLKCQRRIREKRKQMEDDLAVPHTCSYESYKSKLLKARKDRARNGGMGMGIARTRSQIAAGHS